MRKMWSGETGVVSPSDLKLCIGQFAPRFSGYNQQDSSELLFFLLDGLHEDLNLVKQKPFTENIEQNGRCDKVVAREAWDTHLKRNRSIIVDHFQGQIKSTLVCPSCDFVSEMFDPFLALSLPMFSSETRMLPVTLVPGSKSKRCIRMVLELHRFGTIRDVRMKVCKMLNCDENDIVITEIYEKRGYRFKKDNQSINSILKNDLIFIYVVKDHLKKFYIENSNNATRSNGKMEENDDFQDNGNFAKNEKGNFAENGQEHINKKEKIENDKKDEKMKKLDKNLNLDEEKIGEKVEKMYSENDEKENEKTVCENENDKENDEIIEENGNVQQNQNDSYYNFPP
ncbi:Ubiquitin carboxyl-terminal hydrolase 15, partial [Bonamia ostreae]